MRVEINGQRVWPLDSVWKEYKPTEENRGVFDFQDLTFGVNEGDKVVIRINCGGDDGYDGLNFNPVFALAETETPVSNPAVTVSDPLDPEGGGEKQFRRQPKRKFGRRQPKQSERQRQRRGIGRYRGRLRRRLRLCRRGRDRLPFAWYVRGSMAEK